MSDQVHKEMIAFSMNSETSNVFQETQESDDEKNENVVQRIHSDNNEDIGSDTCFIRCEISHLTIDEKYETSIAECIVRLKCTLYWIPGSTNAHDWIPKLQFTNAVKFEKLSERACAVDTQLKHQRILKHIQIMKQKLINDSSDVKKMHVHYTETEYEIQIEEPLELKAYPFDCQDLPIFMSGENFETLAPAPMETSKIDENAIIRTSGNVTKIQSWNMKALLTEFTENGSLKILLKMSRNCKPISTKYLLLLGSVSMLSLTVFALDDDAVADKLEIVLGLILALIFVELPPIPITTMVDKYYYSMFIFLVTVAFESAFSASGILADSKWMVFFWFVMVFVTIHIVLILSAIFTIISENRKINMDCNEMQALLDKNLTKINVYGKEIYNEKRIFLKGSTEAVHVHENKSKYAASNWWKVSLIEWILLCMIIALQLRLSLSQMLSFDLECVHNNSVVETVIYIFFASMAFIIVSFIYWTVGISHHVFKSLIFVLYFAFSVAFCFEVHFFAILTHCQSMDAQIVDKYAWWLLLLSICLFVIVIAIHFCVVLVARLIIYTMNIWVFFFFTIVGMHMMTMAVNVYQFVILSGLSNGNCFEKYNKVLPINIYVVVITAIMQLLFMLIWIYMRMFLAHTKTKSMNQKLLMILWVIIPFFEAVVALHGFIFWIYAISEEMASDENCNSFTYADEVGLLVLHLIWILFASLIIYCIVRLNAQLLM